MNKRLIYVAVLVVAFLPNLLAAQASATPSPTLEPAVKPKLSLCASLAETIEGSLKSIAMTDAESIGDNSAPRATLSTLKINSELLLVSMNLQIARDNGCPALKEPLRTGKYLVAALKCQNDLLRVRMGEDIPTSSETKLPVSCETSNW